MLGKLLARNATYALAVSSSFGFGILVLCMFAVSAPATAAGSPYGEGSYSAGAYNTSSSNTSSGNTSSGGITSKNASTGSVSSSNTSSKSGYANTPASSTNSYSSPQPQVSTQASSQRNSAIWLYGGIFLVLSALIISIWLVVKRHKRNQF